MRIPNNVEATTNKYPWFFWEQNKNTTWLRQIWTNFGSKLAKSGEIGDIINKHRYILETTAAESSFQNAFVQWPHCTLRYMMRSMLTGAKLSNTFWADPLLHAIYVKIAFHTKQLLSHLFNNLKVQNQISHIFEFLVVD